MSGPTPAELDAIKVAIIEAWNAPFRRQEPEIGGARLQVLSAPLPPRGGLAVGHTIDQATGNAKLEFRASASAGPDLLRAESLARQARAEGVDAVVRFFLGVPKVGTANTEVKPLLAGRRRPLHIGSSVAHQMGFAGTLGAFVLLGDKVRGLLSCAHVLAEARRFQVRAGDGIHNPGQPEPIPEENRVGHLSKYFSRFVPARTDNIDAAIAILDPEVETMGNVIPDCPEVEKGFRGRRIGPPAAEVVPGTQVVKVGRTTGFTRGMISTVDIRNFRPELRGRKRITFGQVHEIAWLDGEEPFTEAGDSGSLILSEDKLEPLGIHFCAVPLTRGNARSYMIPWNVIASSFPIRLE
jgi:hypothetical protein